MKTHTAFSYLITLQNILHMYMIVDIDLCHKTYSPCTGTISCTCTFMYTRKFNCDFQSSGAWWEGLGDARSRACSVTQGLRRATQVEGWGEITSKHQFLAHRPWLKRMHLSHSWMFVCAGSGQEDDEPVRAQAARHDGEEDVGQGAASGHHQHRGSKHGVVMTSHGWKELCSVRIWLVLNTIRFDS